jgi:hypothetical protein
VTAVAWMVGASVASWLVATVASGNGINPEALAGMVGPLASALASWLGYERAHRSAPERLTNVMIAAVALKMLFFGAYVIGMVRVVGLRPVPFVVSFAAYFIGLHAMEALFLRRLLRDDLSASGRRQA